MISIITSTYNREDLLPRMLQSILNQTYSNWELVLMDDGSTDGTEKLIERYNDSRIRYFKGENTGAAQKRNEGVSLAKGEYFIQLDSDDEVKEDWLEQFAKHINGDATYLISCAWEKRDHNGNIVETSYPKNMGKMFDNISINILSGSLLMNRKIFLETEGYDTKLNSGLHTEFLIRLVPVLRKHNVKVITINKPLVVIHLHEGERMRSNFDAIYKGCTTTLKKHKELFEQHPDMNFDYNTVAAVMALRTNRLKIARQYLQKAIKIKPWRYKCYIWYIISYFPSIVERFYQKK
ncbi:glycosyltransferase family A protein [Salinimicrobium sp. TIG7-5_MAKvit]|uniref:glycosyltransferase family A protein n=1 Tax=Salinimicrobium sp. TIG7-5_MAKvit TaxID=3121289 RepID=UPI003C6DBB86